LLEIMLEEEINIRFNYIHLNEVMHISKDFHASILSHTYDNECVMQLSVRKSDYQLFILKMKAISGLKLLE
jgi:putative IMPACT (imprinted ancient) family translation regulator